MEPLLPLSIELPEREMRTLLRAFHSQLRAAILDGRLKPGLRLPSTRALATAYHVARNTAVAAYTMLLSEGYVETRRGSGTRVVRTLPKPPKNRVIPDRDTPDRRVTAFWRGRSLRPAKADSGPACLSFQLGVPDASRFPVDVWRRLSNRVLRSIRTPAMPATDPQGRLALRQAIAQHVSFTRAVSCGPEDIVVTAGAQQAFELLARVLVTQRRTTVAMEDPGYGPIRASFEAVGARIAPIPIDHKGLQVDRLPSLARIVCVTPSHQFPLGCVMSVQRRAGLLDFAQAHGAVVIEDDYDGEFRFGDRPLDALQTLDRTESVFYVGTFSKSLHPALRLGYIVAPPWARPTLAAAQMLSGGPCSVLIQDTVAALIRDGHLARHVRKMQQIYGRRRQTLLKILRQDFGRWLDPVPSAAGLHISTFLTKPIDDRVVVARALRCGVGIAALSDFAVRHTIRGVVFGYGAIEEPDIVEGLARLRRSWSSGNRSEGAIIEEALTDGFAFLTQTRASIS
jgi:GntR family transcriptional regulator/MocR family aminotransferase